MSKKNLGIIGGGQLGSMLSEAAKKLDIKVGDKASWRIVERTNTKNIRYYHCLDDF